MHNKQYDLTQGRILDKLLLVSLPMMGTQFMQMAYNLTDMFWLGRVGSDVVAASGTAGYYLWLSQAFLFIGRMGSEIGVSQSLGRGDEKMARRYSQNSLLLAVALGIVFAAVIMLFVRPLIGFFNIQEANVVANAEEYLFVTAVGIPFTFISGAIAGTFNGSGNSRVPFFINAAGLVVNMVLDPVLILTLDMGIFGAAVATVAAQALVSVLSLLAVVWKRTRPFEKYRFLAKPRIETVTQIFRWSTPIALESLLFTFLSMIISRFVSDFGANAIAVQRVGSQIESLSWLIGGGFSSAITAFVGQNFGAGKWERIRQGFRVSLITILVWGSLVTLLLFFAGGPLFRIFLDEPVLVVMGVTYLQILAFCQLAMSVESVSSGTFRGMGKTMPPSAASIISNALRVPMAYFLSLTPLGLNGIWLGVTFGAIIRGVWLFVWLMVEMRRQPTMDID